LGFFDVFRKKKEVPVTENPLAEIGGVLRRIEGKQKEMGLLLEEIDEFLQGGQDGDSWARAFIDVLDLIYDFYRFAEQAPGLARQGGVMLSAAKNAAARAGIAIIDPGNTPFDFNLHTAAENETHETIPRGHVIKTLTCGYSLNGKSLRPATVVVSAGKEETV
jgi:hypothetical protein